MARKSISHRVAYWRLNAGFERTGRMTALRPVQFVRPAPTAHGRFLPVLRALAVGPCDRRSGWCRQHAVFQRPQGKLYETDVGGHRRLCSPMGRRSN